MEGRRRQMIPSRYRPLHVPCRRILRSAVNVQRAALIVAAVLGAASCASPRRPFLAPRPDAPVWPAPPDVPRVRYLGELRGSDDIGDGQRSLLESVLFGPGAPVRLVTPHGVAVDAAGDRVAVTDPNGPCVHVFDLARRTHLRIDRFNAGRDALAGPAGVAWMGDDLIVTDAVTGIVWRAVLDGSARPLGTAFQHLRRPTGVAVDGRNRVYVCETAMHRVVWTGGHDDAFFVLGEGTPSPLPLNTPSHIATSADRRLAVCDSLNFRVVVLDGDDRVLFQVGGKGDAPGNFALPKGMAFDADGNLWVVDAHFENVQAFDREGRLLMAFGGEGRGPGQFWLPAGMCIDARNRMWIADTYNRRVQVFELIRP